MASVHWALAAELYAALLAEDLTDPPSQREELSRDRYYYYGQAVAGLGAAERARELWQLGLRAPDNAGNWPWKPKLTEALRMTEAPPASDQRKRTVERYWG